MKMVLNLNGNVLVVDEGNQPTMLALLASSRMYKSEGWGDKTYTPSEDAPEVSLVKDTQIHGLSEALAAAAQRASEDNTKYYKLYNEKDVVQKQLSALQEKFDALEAVIAPVAEL